MKELKEKILLRIKKFDKNNTMPDIATSLSIVFFLLGFLGLSIISTIISLLFGDALLSLGEGNANALLLFFTYLLLFVFALVLIFVNKPALIWIKSLLKDKSTFIEGANMAILTLCCSLTYGLIASFLFKGTTNNNQSGLEASFVAQPFLTFFCIVIFAPVCEELAYRFGLFGSIAKKSNILAYIVTILVFAFLHFDFGARGDALINEFINLPSYLIGAFFLCYAYQRKGNILTSITAHSIYNGIQYVLMFIQAFIIPS